MNLPKIHVLRLGHRLVRDDRVSTHIGLVARALGADLLYLIGCDLNIKNKIDDVTKRWGGNFQVKLDNNWRDILRTWKENRI